MADLRDDSVVRMAYMNMLFDWDASQLKKVYEPLSQQMGYIFVAFLLCLCGYSLWRLFKRWRKDKKLQEHVPYRVIKPPSSVVEGKNDRKRIVAVVGGTGYVGSWVVDELVSRGDYFVYVLGRKFRKERTNPQADALIQVDLLDDEGILHALQGVDSVINAAALIPNVYSTEFDTWRFNKQCLEHLVRTAKKAGVKNFIFIAGMDMEGRLHNPVARAFVNAFDWGKKFVCSANEEEGMHTCVISPAQIVGLRMSFYEQMISGKLSSFPKVKHRASFLAVEYVAKAIVNAELKLAEGSDKVCGHELPLVGDVATMEKFTSLPAWPHKINDMSVLLLKVIAHFNSLCARWLNWAPLGIELCPAIVTFFENAEATIDSSEVYEILEVGAPPAINEYIKKMVLEYQKNQEKKNKDD